MSSQAYAWNAQDYARHSAVQLEWARELIAKLSLAGSETVLDIGCGDGKVTALLAQAVPSGKVVGVDRSAAMVRLARAQFAGSAGSNLAFAQMDAARLGFCQGFTAAFSNATLHWVKDHQAVLEGTARALQPGGRILFQMGGRGNAAGVIAVLEQVMARGHWQPYFQRFPFPYTFLSPEQYQPLLATAGLKALRVELVPKDMRHAGPEGLAGWFRTTWLPYLERVPEDQRRRFLEELVEVYLQHHPPDRDGAVHVQMVRLEVEAEKIG